MGGLSKHVNNVELAIFDVRLQSEPKKSSHSVSIPRIHGFTILTLMIRRLIFSFAVLWLSFLSCQKAICQIKVEAIQLPSRLRTAPQWQQDQYRIETAMDVAHKATKKIGRNVTVYLSSGDLVRSSADENINSAKGSGYEFKVKTYRLRRPVVVPGGVVLAGEGLGRREARLLWEDCQSNSALLIFRSGFGGGLRNVDIRLASNLKNRTNVTALYLQSQSSAVFRDFAINLSNIGPDSNGIVIARLGPNQTNNESLKFQDFNISASRPVIIMSGDNLHFENFDCICSMPVREGLSAIFQNWNGNPPGNWTIGPGTGQKGDHAIALTGTTNRRGTSLVVFGYQWEQGSGKGPAWLFDIDHPGQTNPDIRAHFIESLTMINCRNARQKQSPDYVSVRLPDDSYLKAEIIGGFFHGKMDIGRPRWSNKPQKTNSPPSKKTTLEKLRVSGKRLQ